jgi:exodeoxyribonuclease-3
MKIISWNVNGIRAQVKKDFFDQFNNLDADLFCLQETKAQDDQVAEALTKLSDAGYHIYSNSATKKGYSGTAIICKEEPISVLRDIGVEEHDDEGRVTGVETKDFYLINVYVPNGGSGMKRLDYRSTWDVAFAKYLTKLQKKKPVIVTGDFNVAHNAIDLANPKSNYNKTSGYTQVEIDGFSNILAKAKLVDSYRHFYPEDIIYTYWSLRTGARARNAGWRIDYFLVSERLMDSVKDVVTHTDVMGSDHCPVELVM